MSTVLSSEFITQNPDEQIPGTSLIPYELNESNVINNVDNVPEQKVLSREELVQNYAKEKKVGHLSSQLATARQNVDDEIACHKIMMREKDECLRQQIAERERVEALLTVTERQLVSVKESNTNLKNEIEQVNQNAQLISKEYMCAIEKNQQTSSKYEHFDEERKQMNHAIESLKRELSQTKHLKQLVEEKLEHADSANIQVLGGMQNTSALAASGNVERLMKLNNSLKEKLGVKEMLLEQTTVAFNDLLYDYKYLYNARGRAKNLYVNDCYKKWNDYNQHQLSTGSPRSDTSNGTVHSMKQANTCVVDQTVCEHGETISRMKDQLEKMKLRYDELKVDNKAHVVENKKLLASIKQLQVKVESTDTGLSEKENLKEQLKNKEEQINVHSAFIQSLKENCKDLVEKVQKEHDMRIEQLSKYQSMQDEIARYKEIIARYEQENDEKVSEQEEFRKEVASMLSESFNKYKTIVADTHAQKEKHQFVSEQKVLAPAAIPGAPVTYVNNYTVGDSCNEKKSNSADINESSLLKNLKKEIDKLNERLIERDNELALVRSENANQRRKEGDLKSNLEMEVKMLNARLNHVEQQKQDLNERLDNTQKDLRNVQLANDEKVEEKKDNSVVMDLKQHVEELNSRLVNMEQEKDALNNKLDDTQQELLSFRLAAKNKSAQCQQSLKSEIEELGERVASVESVSELVKSVESLDAVVASVESLGARVASVENLGARVATVESLERDLNDRLDDTQQDLINARLSSLRSHEKNIKKFNSDLKELEEELQLNMQQQIGSVENLRRRDSSRIIKLKNRQKDVLAKQRADFDKFEHAQKESIARLARDIKQNLSSEYQTSGDINNPTHVSEQKLSSFQGVTDKRFNAVMNMQSRAFSSLCDRLDHLEGELKNCKDSDDSDNKRGKKFEQLKQRISGIEQSLVKNGNNMNNNTVRVVVSERDPDKNPETDRQFEERIKELKEKHSRLQTEKFQALQDAADKKDETISSLLTAVKQQEPTKTEDNKIQFINTWNMNRGDDSATSQPSCNETPNDDIVTKSSVVTLNTRLPSCKNETESSSTSDSEIKVKIPYVPVTFARSPAASDSSSTEDELFVPRSSSDEKVISSRRKKSRKVKSTKAVSNQKDSNAQRGMPIAEGETQAHTDIQCGGESLPKHVEHLSCAIIKMESDASVSSKPSKRSSKSDFDSSFFDIEPAAKPEKSLEKKKNLSSEPDVLSADDTPVVEPKIAPKKEKKIAKTADRESDVSSSDDAANVEPKNAPKKGKKLVNTAVSQSTVSSSDDAANVEPKNAPKKGKKLVKTAVSQSTVSSSDDAANVEPKNAPKKGKKLVKTAVSQSTVSSSDDAPVVEPKNAPKKEKKIVKTKIETAVSSVDDAPINKPKIAPKKEKLPANTADTETNAKASPMTSCVEAKPVEKVISHYETPALPPSGKQSAFRLLSVTLPDSSSKINADTVPPKKKLPIWLQPTIKPEVKPEENIVEEPLIVPTPIPTRRTNKELPIWLQPSPSKTIPENAAVETTVQDVPKAGRRRTLALAGQNNTTSNRLTSPTKEEPAVRRNVTSRRSLTAEQVIANAHGSLAKYTSADKPSSGVDSTARRNTFGGHGLADKKF